jgi:RimJ/RimL family protein N-acetyltransferase
MILVKQAKTEQEQTIVFKALPVLNPNNGIYIYAFWENNKCIGAFWLDVDYPHYMNYEFYNKSSLIVKAISEAFKELFKIKNCLTIRIKADNLKSLKMAKQLGFYTLYEKDGFIIKEITSKTWRYHKRYPLI